MPGTLGAGGGPAIAVRVDLEVTGSSTPGWRAVHRIHPAPRRPRGPLSYGRGGDTVRAPRTTTGRVLMSTAPDLRRLITGMGLGHRCRGRADHRGRRAARRRAGRGRGGRADRGRSGPVGVARAAGHAAAVARPAAARYGGGRGVAAMLLPRGPGFVLSYMAMAGIGLQLPRRIALPAGAVVLVAAGLAQAHTSPQPVTAGLSVATGAAFLFLAAAFAAVSRDKQAQAQATGGAPGTDPGREGAGGGAGRAQPVGPRAARRPRAHPGRAGRAPGGGPAADPEHRRRPTAGRAGHRTRSGWPATASVMPSGRCRRCAASSCPVPTTCPG